MGVSGRALVAALVPLVLLAAGCASIPRDKGFGQVSQEVEKRTGYRVAWDEGGEADKEVQARIDQWLDQGLSLGTAVQIGLLNNRRLQATYESLGIAQASLVQAGLLKNPVFEGALRFPTGGGGSIFEFSVVQSFLDLVMIPLQRKVARAEVETVKLKLTAAAMDLAFEIRTVFYDLLSRAQGLALSRELLLATDLAYQAAQRLKSSGAITDLELAERRYAFELTRLEKAELEEAYFRDRERLNRLLGLWGKRTGWRTAAELRPVPEEPLDLSDLERRAIERSLDLEIARSQLLTAARRMGINNITSIIGEFEAGVDAEREEDGAWSVGPVLSLEIPIFDQGRPVRSMARAEMRRRWEEYTALAIDIRSRAREAGHRLQQARARSLHYAQVLLPLRKEITHRTQQHYNAMQVGVFRLLTAKRMETAAGREYLDELRAYWSARAELEQVLNGRLISGRLLEKAAPERASAPDSGGGDH